MIANIISYVQNHWLEIVSVYTSIVGLASIVVKLTPNLRDDDVLKGVIRFVGKYIALNRSSTPNV